MKNLFVMTLVGAVVLAASPFVHSNTDAEFVQVVASGTSSTIAQIRGRSARLAAKIFDALKDAHQRCDRSTLPICRKSVGQVGVNNPFDPETGLNCKKQTNLRTRELLDASCKLAEKHNADAIYNALKVPARCLGGRPDIDTCSKFVGGLSCSRPKVGGSNSKTTCRLNLPK